MAEEPRNDHDLRDVVDRWAYDTAQVVELLSPVNKDEVGDHYYEVGMRFLAAMEGLLDYAPGGLFHDSGLRDCPCEICAASR
jgi:hypothetical protein